MDDISVIIANLNQILVDDKCILEVYYSNKHFNSDSNISSFNFSQYETILIEEKDENWRYVKAADKLSALLIKIVFPKKSNEGSRETSSKKRSVSVSV